MKEKLFYVSPECETFDYRNEGCIAQSAPNFDEEDLFD